MCYGSCYFVEKYSSLLENSALRWLPWSLVICIAGMRRKFILFIATCYYDVMHKQLIVTFYHRFKKLENILSHLNFIIEQ